MKCQNIRAVGFSSKLNMICFLFILILSTWFHCKFFDIKIIKIDRFHGLQSECCFEFKLCVTANNERDLWTDITDGKKV